MLHFSVAKKYTKGPEQHIAKFYDMNDAKEFIHRKIKQDITMNVNAVYLLYDAGELMETFDQNSIDGDVSSSGQQQSSTQSFRPSPMQTTMRPPGMPHNSFKDEGDDKKKQ